MQVEGETAVARWQLDWVLTLNAELRRWSQSHLTAPQGDAGLRSQGLQIGVERFVRNTGGLAQPDRKLRLAEILDTFAQPV